MRKEILVVFMVLLLIVSGCAPKTNVTQAQVTILTPVNGSFVPGSGLVDIIAEVNNSVSVSRVRFYVDGEFLAEKTVTPYKATWDTSYYKHGTAYTIKVEALDGSGKVIGSSSIVCYINVEWTILMYLDGHNDLENYIQQDISYISSFSRTDGVNIVILAGPKRYVAESYLYYFHNGKLDILESGLYNFGNSNLLYYFLKYSVSNFPAKRYLVVLENHGSGWRAPAREDRDICFDEISGDSLTIPELREGLSYFTDIGKKIDLLYFDACVMGNLEVAYELKDVANYLVFSEANVIGQTRWDQIMSYILSNPSTTPESLGRKIIDIYYSNYSIKPITMSLIDLSKISAILGELYYFSSYLMNTLPDSASAIMNIRLNTLSFEPYGGSNKEYIDINDFAYKIINNSNYNELTNSAYNLVNYVNSAVLYHKYSGFNYTCGLSIWFPAIAEDFLKGYNKYKELKFYNNSGGFSWYSFIVNELYYYFQVPLPSF
ncbi:hypothetical protein FY122_08720 [Dictyoglomus thermophilum]|uniref:clostripain-related cysteine peptidase n=1 Tax=Dictyoglomus thermophilum TaxID=14 RepID=UPI0011EAB049|nr:clostripain-related cysteine peptidase [Dictyoglomus thermophilum]TYT21064.1 hypothetical protein FY122_08720 [Dictyoglomus thermophilum]